MAAADYFSQVQKIYVAYYGRPADPAGLSYWGSRLDAAGGNLSSIINAFGTSSESTALYTGDNSAKVTAIYQQLFNRAPDTAGLNFYTGELTAGRMTAASIALNVANGASGTDATYLSNKLTVASAFTDALNVDSAAAVAYAGTSAATSARSLISGVTTSAATTNVASTVSSIKSGGGAAAGQTFTLTTDDDSPILTLGNDTITGTSATLSVDDRIVDGSTKDSDTLNLTLTADPPALNARNIEKININWDAFQTLDSDLDDVQSSTITVTSSKVGFGGSANFTNVGENKIVAGTGFTATINADGLEDGSVTASAARTVILGATTAADGTVTVDAPVASTVTITGGDDVSVNAPNATAVTVTSAGADTVNLTLGKTSTVTSTGTTSDVVLRSAAAITVTLADNTAFDTLKADSTISLRLADSSDFSGDEISGAASVRIDDDAGGAFDAELFNVPLVRYTLAQTTGTHTYANGAKLQADVDFGAAMTFATSTSEDSTNDSISLTVKATQTKALTFDTTDRDFETVNLAIDGVGAVTLANVDAGAGTVNLTSNQNITLTLLDAAELNASTLTKNLTVTQNTAGDLTIVAGSGTNTATFTGTTDDSAYSGGAGNDTVTFVNTKGDASAAVFDGVNSITANAITTGTLAVVGGSGNDTVSATALTTGQAVLDLGAGVNSVTAGANNSGGTYAITGGSGNDAITLTGTTLTITASVGDGVNSLTANTLTTGSATYTGGAGNDTISATAHTTGTLTVTAGDGTNALTAGTTTGTVVFVGGSGNDTVALASGTTGSFNINVADGSANSVTLTATTGAVTITGGAGVDTVSLTTLTTGTAVIDTGAEADAITVTGTFAAGGSVSVTAGAGNDTITYTTATASGFTTVINGGDGTDTVELGVQAGGTVRDYTDGTITLTGIEIIDIGSSTTDTLVDGDLLNGKSYTIIGDGTATDQLTVHLDTGGTYDFSSIGISATVGTALGGLAIAAQAAATTNSITATAGNDSIDGGTGVDTMVGGGGADTLVGGTGNDVFVLGTTAQTRVTGYATASGAVTAVSVDYFEDFNNSGTDRIQLSSAAGAYGTGLTLSTSATVNIVQVDVTTDCDNLTELVAAVQAASAGVASSSTAVRVYVVSLDAGGDLQDGSFIIVNDGTAALGVTDTIVAVGTTTLSGIVASNFVIV